MTNILTKEQIKNIKICGKYLNESLTEAVKAVKPGVSTKYLDEIAEKELRKRGCKPSFKNYYVPGAGKYPASLCVAVNDEIVHGIPSDKRILKEGDIISLDIGAEYEGIFTDMATTVPVGEISDKAKMLLESTKESLMIGITHAIAGNHIGDIGNAIENFASFRKLGVVKDYVGHGIGTQPHMAPQIPNFGTKGTGPAITENMALAIEPMLTLGREETALDSDGWTVRTYDGSLSAHFEHTVIIENGKPVIVTQ